MNINTSDLKPLIRSFILSNSGNVEFKKLYSFVKDHSRDCQQWSSWDLENFIENKMKEVKIFKRYEDNALSCSLEPLDNTRNLFKLVNEQKRAKTNQIFQCLDQLNEEVYKILKNRMKAKVLLDNLTKKLEPRYYGCHTTDQVFFLLSKNFKFFQIEITGEGIELVPIKIPESERFYPPSLEDYRRSQFAQNLPSEIFLKNEIASARNNKVMVRISNVSNPWEMHINLHKNVPSLNQLLDEMEKIYYGIGQSLYDINTKEIRIGMYCAALYPNDKDWYRGKVEQLSDNRALISYVDFGWKNWQTLENIKHLDKGLNTYQFKRFQQSFLT